MEKYMSLGDIARVGDHPINMLKSRIHQGNFPEPDGKIGLGDGTQTRYGWLPASVAEYLPEDFSLE